MSITTCLIILATTFQLRAQTVLDFKWLEGKWKQNETGLFEEWHFVNDTLANGMAYNLSDDGEIVFEEIIQLKQMNGGVYYIPVVKKQNNQQPVPFRIVSSSNRFLVAENPAHDFPQRIKYRLMSPLKLIAQIEDLSGKRKMKFVMLRVK